MSGCRRRMQRPWDRGHGPAPPQRSGRPAGRYGQGGNRMDDRRLVGIDLGIASAHTVRVLAGDGSLVCRRKAAPTVESLAEWNKLPWPGGTSHPPGGGGGTDRL